LGYINVLGFETVGINTIGAPLGLTMLIGSEKHNFATSAGALAGYYFYDESSCFGESCDYENRFNLWPIVEFGYRYTNPDKQFLFQIKVGSQGLLAGFGKTF